MLRLYDYPLSGNSYKVRLLLRQLELPFERVERDILRGETRTPEFLQINPNGRIPVLRMENGEHLAESNAILWYLAYDTPLLPRSRQSQARVLKWMFFEQYSHEPNIATSHYYRAILKQPERYAEALERRQKPGYAALDVMEQHLGQHRFLVDRVYTIADIALYANTHLADKAGFDLAAYPAIRDWLMRVALEPQHVGIEQACGYPVSD